MRHCRALFLTAAALLGGCVSTATHQKTLDAKTALESSLQGLQAEHRTLQQENERCLGDRNRSESRAAEAQSLLDEQRKNLERTQADVSRLEKVLTDRDQATGRALAELRREVDRLTAGNRSLEEEKSERLSRVAALEKENSDLRQENEKLAGEKSAREEELQASKATYGALIDQMRGEIARGDITISDLKGRLTVNLVDQILFDSGSASLKKSGQELIIRLADALAATGDKEIRVAGHTDNLPISSRLQATYQSNWELSTARALSVVHALEESKRLAGSRLSAAGYGEFRPIADNTSAEGRARNRRIEIVLVPLNGSEN